MLTPDLQRLWLDTYEVAKVYYGPKFEAYAAGTAWHAVMWKIAPANPQPRILPKPEHLTTLARMLECVSVENAPQLTVVRFGPNVRVENKDMSPDAPVRIYHIAEEPDLLWEDQQKYLLAMPGYQLPSKANPPKKGTPAYKAFKRFTKQHPEREFNLGIPKFEIWPFGPADTVVYRSTKWTKKRGNTPGAQEYIHQFGPDVLMEVSPNEDAFLFQGGKLDMVAAGIIN